MTTQHIRTYCRELLGQLKVLQFQCAILHFDFIKLIVTQTDDRWRRLYRRRCRRNGVLEFDFDRSAFARQLLDHFVFAADDGLELFEFKFEIFNLKYVY